MLDKSLPGLPVIDGLAVASREAFEHQHFLESAIIIFQAIEFLLRLAIRRFGERRGVSEMSLVRAAEREMSFRRLVLHLDLVYPENKVSRRLLSLNRRRNSIIHRLSDEFESIETLHGRIETLCTKGFELYKGLRELAEGSGPNLDERGGTQ